MRYSQMQIAVGGILLKTARALIPKAIVLEKRGVHASFPVLWSEVDGQGRRVRSRAPQRSAGGWDDFDPMGDQWDLKAESPKRENWSDSGSSRDWKDDSAAPRRRQKNDRPSRTRRTENNEFHGSGRGAGGRSRISRTGGRGRQHGDSAVEADRKTNMKALEGAGFVHLYGLASVLNALEADKRSFDRPEDRIDIEELTGADLNHEIAQRDRKPEAQFTTWLFCQAATAATSARSQDKAAMAERVEALAKQRGISCAQVDKGVLNTLSGNRPHQGYVLRCGPLYLESIARLPRSQDNPESPSFWLVLDQVVDPQNLGALLRSCYFMGGSRVGVVVCAKNSAPLSPTVSAASAGALELIPHLFDTANLPKLLSKAESDGFRIVGASASVPYDRPGIPLHNLRDLRASSRSQPTVLVLGSEGHGLRQLVAKGCTEFVRIPGAQDITGVDSLNVSVSGALLLWHLFGNEETDAKAIDEN